MIEWNAAKILIVLFLVAAIVSLLFGLAHLMKSKDGVEDQRAVFRSLVKRIGFSLTAMALILIAGFSGLLDK